MLAAFLCLALSAVEGLALSAVEGLSQDLLRMEVEELFPPQVEPTDRPFYLGTAWGYVANRDAEEGAWSITLFGRGRLSPEWSLEASISFYYHEFVGDDVRVTRFPLQLSALWFPFRPDVLRPYLAAGPGLYPLRVTYKDAFDAFDTEEDLVFGAHFGGGAEMQMGSGFSALFDFRFLILDEPDLDSEALEDTQFDSWQVTLGFGWLF